MNRYGKGLSGFFLVAILAPALAMAGLVAHYDFEDGTGSTVSDVSPGGGHDGTIQNPDATDWVPGKVGNYALDLDGNDQVVTTLNSTATEFGINGNNPKSVACWVYTRQFDNGAPFQIGQTGATGEMFSWRTLTGSESWRAQFWGGPDFDGVVWGSLNGWVHFTLVHDGSQGRLYVNGFRAYFEGPSTLNTDNDRAFEIGRYGDNDFFNGIVDDMRVYDHALSQVEVQALAGTTFGAADKIADSFTIGSPHATNVQGFVVEQTRRAGVVSNVDMAEDLIAGRLAPDNPGGGYDLQHPLINFGPGTHGDFVGDASWSVGDNYALKVWGVLDIPAAGTHSFGCYSDDGFRLRIGKSETQVSQRPSGGTAYSWDTAVYFEEGGLYPFSLYYHEATGGEGLEISHWTGDSTSPGGSRVLLNDTNSGSITVYQNVLTVDDRYGAAVSGGAEFLSARHVYANAYNVNSVLQARDILDGIATPVADRREALPLISMITADFAGMQSDYFGGEFTGVLNIPAVGVYEFVCSSDDGYTLEIGKNNTVVAECNVPKGTNPSGAKVAFLIPGLYPFRLT